MQFMNRKTVTVVTATRAEYGLLKPIVKRLVDSNRYIVRIVVTGAHISPEFGFTYKEIEQDGYEIDDKIPILLSSDSSAGISKSMGLAMIGFGDYFERKPADMLILLGDRYETLAVACAALNARIPIAHLQGGETTEGAADEAFRHAITKMSWLHFTSTEEYRKRVIQLGENPERVFNVGALGVENALHTEFMTLFELETSIRFSLDKQYAVVTFHPVTLEGASTEEQIDALLTVFGSHPEMKFIITGANADAGGWMINQKVKEYVGNHDNALSVTSLGMRRYLSALHYASMVIGNSSSGIIEAPSFHIPTINIGDRQKGRLQAESVINCEPTVKGISAAIALANSPSFRKIAKNALNPYGDGNTSSKILERIDKMLKSTVDLKKSFYDISFEI